LHKCRVHVPAAREEHFGRAFYVERGAAAGVSVEGGHELALGIEGNRAEARTGIARAGHVDAGLLRRRQQSELGGVSVCRTGFAAWDGVVAQHSAQVKLTRISGRSPDGLNGEPILCQSAGLVRGHDGRAPQGLDRREVPDDRPAPSHPLDADGERDRNDRREPLGHGGDGQADARESGI
jgi:hypothetical protein